MPLKEGGSSIAIPQNIRAPEATIIPVSLETIASDRKFHPITSIAIPKAIAD